MTKLDQYRTMLSQQEESEAEKTAIVCSDKYQEIEMLIAAKRMEQEGLLSGVVDYSEALRDLEQEILDVAKMSGIYENEEYKIKFKKSGTVNVYALRETLQDEDFFFEFVKIPQKAVKDHLKEAGEKAKEAGTEKEFKPYKKAVMSCIEITEAADKVILKD